MAAKEAGKPIRWLGFCGRTLIWLAMLLPICQILSTGYYAWLGVATKWLLSGTRDIAVRYSGIPFDVGVFLSLSLASSWESWRRRARLGTVGAFVMLAVHLAAIATGAMLLGQGNSLSAGAWGRDPFLERSVGVGLRGLFTVLPIVAWFALFGRHLPILSEAAVPDGRD